MVADAGAKIPRRAFVGMVGAAAAALSLGDRAVAGAATRDGVALTPCGSPGIECPQLLSASAPNYWSAAWAEAQPPNATQVRSPVGLGVNSIKGRSQSQLHIHMAELLSGIPGQLDTLYR